MLPYATSARVIITNHAASVNDYFSENQNFSRNEQRVGNARFETHHKENGRAFALPFFEHGYFTLQFKTFDHSPKYVMPLNS